MEFKYSFRVADTVVFESDKRATMMSFYNGYKLMRASIYTAHYILKKMPKNNVKKAQRCNFSRSQDVYI